MATAVYSSHSGAVSLGPTNSGQRPAEEEQYFSTFFCRALYDYQTDNDSSLSFRKDDIIEVLTKLESGWWDGLLGQERGWFPSNYVTVISDFEADTALSAPEPEPDPSSTNSYSTIDPTHALTAGRSQSQDWEQPLRLDVNLPTHQNHTERAVAPTSALSNDFWVPQVSLDGRIYYMNTQTGQQSLDLPQDVDQDMSDGDLAVLATQPNDRNVVLGLATATNAPAANGHENGQAGFGVPVRTGTPEPWKKMLADDGMSYYFLNTLDGSVSWTLPSTDSAAPPGDPNLLAHLEDSILSLITNPNDRDATLVPSTKSSLQRLRSDSAVSHSNDPGYSTDPYSVHSDDSDIQPVPRQRSGSSTSTRRHGSDSTVASPLKSKPRTPPKIPELTSAEHSAQLLQQALASPPPDSVNDLSTVARQAITTVVQYIKSHDVISHSRYGQELNDRVLAVVFSVRNLLYVSATPSGHIPSNLYSRDARQPRPTPAPQTLQAHLKPTQRKVAGTLSKLVLTTLAIQYDSGGSSAEKLIRMEADASELERAIVTFVLEVQRFLNQNSLASGKNPIKRLHGVFSAQNIGLGLVGGGAAGSWKGFGWLALDEMEDAPHKLLSVEVVSELKIHVSKIEAKCVRFTEEPVKVPDVLARECQEFIQRLFACITFVSNIHVARHVDIDGINVDNGHAPNDLYLQTVDKARRLVRTLEVAVQALYDDGASFLLTAQTIRSDIGGSPIPWNSVLLLSASLRQNLELVCKSCEALLSVGHDQAELGQGDYNGSIEWRMSRISVVDHRIGNGPPVPGKDVEEEMVDMELAFSRRSQTKTKAEPPLRTKFYRNPSQSSETSLEPVSESYSEAAGDPSATPTRSADQTSTAVSSKSTDVPPSLGAGNETTTTTLFEDEGPAASSKSPPRGSKLRKILGDDAPQAYIDKVNADLKKWYLRPDHSPPDLQTDPEGSVRGGTIQALVERLTTHDAPDTKFNKTFLMTYKSFTNTDHLFELLVQRFWIQPPETITPQELEEWKKFKQHVVRARVLNTFKSMVVDDDILEVEDSHIFQRMKEFASTEAVVGSAAAKQLMIHIERAQRGNDIKVTMTTPGSVPPAPIIPKGSKSKLKITDVDPLEMARQLTLMESQLYQKIRPSECLQRSRDQKGDNSDNISSVIQFANQMANWVAESVLAKEDSRRRATVVKHFIHVADRCRTLQNFSSMFAIVSGLNTPPIRRLKRTWEQVPARFMTLLSTCEMTMDTNKNFNNYRAILSQIIPPCVPFIGVFLTQLTFIHENPNNIGPNLVNFRKRQKTAEVIQDIKRWQSAPYNLHPVQSVFNFIEESLSSFNDGQDFGDHFWNLSLEREPREREDEKMARLLQESGFL